jgi:hypothetical protein
MNGTEMITQPQLHLERVATAGEPAAMIATWMMGELLHVPGLTVAFEHPDRVVLQTLSSSDLALIRGRIDGLLSEPRFASWAVREC